MMINRKKTVAIWAMCLLTFSGCGLFASDNSPMLQIGEHEYSAGVCAVLAAADASEIQAEYGIDMWGQTIDGVLYDDLMRSQAQDDVENILLFTSMARDEQVALSEGELQIADQITSRIMNSDTRKKSGADKAEVLEAAQAYCLAVKYQESIRTAADSSVQNDMKMITGRQLTLRFNDDQQRADAKRTITEVKEELRSGKTLNQLVSLYAMDDPIMVDYSLDETTEEWKKALFDLPVNQTSDVIELDDRYILFQRIDRNMDEEEADANQDAREKAEKNLLESTSQKYAADHEVIWDFDRWNEIQLADLAGAEEDQVFDLYKSMMR